jgi:ribosomal-protein-alanine N-acetyltransferase
MSFTFAPMAEADARAVAAWEYPPPHDVYNVPAAYREESARSFLDPGLGYHAARLGGELAGFCCFGPDARVPGGDYRREELLDVGLGLRPDLAGRGLGLAFVESILAFADVTRAPAGYRLTVAVFNQRAIRVYERAGFRLDHTFERPGEDGAIHPWVQMVTEASYWTKVSVDSANYA